MLATIQFRVLSSHLLFKTLKIKIYNTTILPVISYGCKSWSFTLLEKTKIEVV